MKNHTQSNRVDIMVDIETLGNKTDSTIIQLSAVAFDVTTGESLPDKTFNAVANIDKNKGGIHVTGSTLKWWINTNTELFKELLTTGRESSEDILINFYWWIKALQEEHGEKNVYLWGNGILFDNKMIQHQMESLDLKYPIFYRNDRDVRTILELTNEKLGLGEYDLKNSLQDEMESFTAHNALDDCMLQIRLVCNCWKILTRND